MTSIAFSGNGTEYGPSNFEVSGFYGPGGWAAWCISLVASWAPNLLEDYTHNFHVIAYALYMNWAALNSSRFLFLGRKFDELAFQKKKLDRDHFISFTNGNDTLIFQRHWPSDSDNHRVWEVDTIPETKNITHQILGAEVELSNMTGSFPGLWDYYTIPTTTDLTIQLKKAEIKLAYTTVVLDQQETSLWNQLHQLQAALATLNVGMLHAGTQLFVRLSSIHEYTSTEAITSCRRRNLIIMTGLILPSIIQIIDMVLNNRGVKNGWPGPLVWSTGMIGLTTSWCLGYSYAIAPQLPSLGTVTWWAVASIYALTIAGLYGLYFCSLSCMYVEGPRCSFMPHMSSKITEVDQAFALFAALLYLVYDFRSYFVGFLKFLRLRFEKLLFGAQAHHNTCAGMPLGLPY